MTRTLIVAAVVIAGARGFSRAQDTPNAANGKRVFEKDGCYECHGYAGQGGRDGARIAATTMPAPAFVRYVRRPSGAMPAFTQKVLSDQELADIYAYLKSLPAAKSANEIPLLNRARKR
ncbi:MAG TPA: cytochrome c [Vicinamibacterales bacterium]|nr:cytochrome c [Vicinamibacterales bacterium]